MAFIYPKDGMNKNCLKIVLWGPLNTEMAKTVTLGSANPPTVTNLGGAQKLTLFTPETEWIKIAQKRPLESPENTEMAKTVTLGSANPLTVTNLGGETQKMNFVYLKDGKGKNCLETFLGVH